MDTGAEVTAITEQSFQSIGSPCLQKPQKQLRGPNKHPLDVVGTFTTTVSYKNKSCSTDIYVVRNLAHNLLGLPVITDLHLIVLVDVIQSDRATLQQKFPSLFTGLGTLQNKYDIRLKPDAKPFSLSTARHVPIPLRAKVQAELDYMQSLNVISKVDQPTPWYAGMVVVPKKAGKVRICVDLKPLNESVLRENHPLPHVDEILAQLNGATIFSKLDANSGFWQIPFTEQSKLLTTFITPFGHYCFNNLPFGITSAPEFFQKQMSAILAGLEGVLCLMDDILVFGKDRAEHDKRLYMAMNQVQQAGVTLNAEKCEFWKDKLTFLGHIVSKQGISPDPDKLKAIAEIPSPTTVTELRRFMGMATNWASSLLNWPPYLSHCENCSVVNKCGHGVHPKKKRLLR